MATFVGPTDRIPFAGLLSNWRYDRGRTVYRLNSVWYETSDPYWDTIKDADLVAVADRPGGERTDGTDRDRYLFLGGRTYTVSSAVATALTNAAPEYRPGGYAAFLT